MCGVSVTVPLTLVAPTGYTCAATSIAFSSTSALCDTSAPASRRIVTDRASIVPSAAQPVATSTVAPCRRRSAPSCARVISTSTGRPPQCLAATAAATSRKTSSFRPNPPPSGTGATSTASAATPSSRATRTRTTCGVCEVQWIRQRPSDQAASAAGRSSAATGPGSTT